MNASMAEPGNAHDIPCIDLLYDYAGFLRSAEGVGGFGRLPAQCAPSVAIVGAGIAGLVAARELLRCGVTRLSLFEASSRSGGRLWSPTFEGVSNDYLAEMGGMRFPRSEVCLFHYLDRLGIGSTHVFPDPGQVDTELHYNGQSHLWKAGDSPPPLFGKVHRGWTAFIAQGATLRGTHFAAPLQLRDLLRQRRFAQARREWQKYLDAFGDLSFYSAIVELFTCATPPGGERWDKPADFDLFGALGIGAGGFRFAYTANFNEIIRLVVNGYMDDQRLIVGGTSLLCRRLADPDAGSAGLHDRIRFEHEVTAIERASGRIRLRFAHGETAEFDRVVVTASPRLMQRALKLTRETAFFDHDTERAINNTHVVGASKLFVLTRDKFWLRHGLAHTIQTDRLARAVYCLDYQPHDPQGHGVVLLSYTWAGDSEKLLSTQDKEKRCKLLVEDLSAVAPDFARHVVPLDGDYPRYVLAHDWLADDRSSGAFKLNLPGEDDYSRRLFFNFKNAGHPERDTGVYLAGCSCSFTGGWAEGALQTAINAVCAVIRSCGGELLQGNPLDTLCNHYRY